MAQSSKPKAPYPKDPDPHLLRAIQRNDLDGVNAALEKGAAINARYNAAMCGMGNRVVLIAAVQCASAPLIEHLLRFGANPNTNADEGETATSEAWLKKRHLLPLLQRYGGDLELAFRQGKGNRGILYQTLDDLQADMGSRPEVMTDRTSWFHTGGDLPALIAMGARWDRVTDDGMTPNDALFDWFPPVFADRVMAFRAVQEQTLLRTLLNEEAARVIDGPLTRKRL